jgi:hypothetical protein
VGDAMIVSHRNRFIFIKTFKTAGTSIEIALSKYCGPDDIITPVSQKDEEKRQALGYRGPQNYSIPITRYSFSDLVRAIIRKRRLLFYNHTPASTIMKYIDDKVWDSYYKFCFERNPWDKVVSYYYYRYKNEPRPRISEFIQSGDADTVSAFDRYSCSSEIVVDKVYKYEQLSLAMEDIRERIGLVETPQLPRTKTNYRKEKAEYQDLLSIEDREAIAKVFAREIAYFNYRW